MHVSDGADGVDVGAVVGADAGVFGREDLEVPAWRGVGFFEGVVGEEGEGRALEARSEDDYVAGDKVFVAGSAFGDAIAAEVEAHAVLFEGDDVAAEPAGFAIADLFEEFGVGHGGLGEEAARGGDVGEVTVEKFTEEGFGDPGEGGFLAEDVHGQEGLDEDVSGNNPFIGSGEDVDFSGLGFHSELEGLDGAGTAANDEDSFAFDLSPVEFGGVVYFALEAVLVWHCRHFRITAHANGCDDAVEAAVLVFLVIDNPSAVLRLFDGSHWGIECRVFLQAIPLPEVDDLFFDLCLGGIGCVVLH